MYPYTSLICTSGTTGAYHIGSSNRPFSKAAASEEARGTRRYVGSLTDARTTLTDFFSILLVLNFRFGNVAHHH